GLAPVGAVVVRYRGVLWCRVMTGLHCHRGTSISVSRSYVLLHSVLHPNRRPSRAIHTKLPPNPFTHSAQTQGRAHHPQAVRAADHRSESRRPERAIPEAPSPLRLTI